MRCTSARTDGRVQLELQNGEAVELEAEAAEVADVEEIEGIPPTIAIEQRSAAHNPRSTVATTGWT